MPETKEPCYYCGKPSTGFYVIYEWDEELELNVTITGAYLCDECKEKYGYDE